MTSSNSITPNFFLVGAAKSGTTSLYHYLKQHPEIYLPPIKEVNFFCTDILPENFRPEYAKSVYLDVDAFIEGGMKQEIFHSFIRNEEQYEKIFLPASGKKAIGELSNTYLYSTLAAKNIYEKFPSSKIVMILRNPVERAFSHYLMDLKIGIETGTFLEAVKKDMSKPAKGWGISNLYIEIGMYYEQVKRFLTLFSSEQVKIFLYEDFRKNSSAVLQEICSFLNVDSHFSFNILEEHNKSVLPKSKWIASLSRQPKIKKWAKKVLPKSLRSEMKKQFYTDKNLPGLTTDDRAYLIEIFRSDIENLSSLISRDLSSWTKTK